MTEKDLRNIQLVAKLRKIKENLEYNNYLNSELRARHVDNKTPIDDESLKWLKNPDFLNEIRNGDSTTKESPMSMVNSIFKYSLINRHNFEFDMNINSSVFDNILDDVTANSSSLPIKIQVSRESPSEKRANSKLAPRNKHFGSAEIPIINLSQPSNAVDFVSINKTMYSDNVSRQSSIRSLINCSSTENKEIEKPTKNQQRTKTDLGKNALVNLDSLKLKKHSRHLASPKLRIHDEPNMTTNKNLGYLNQQLAFEHSEATYPISLSPSLNSSILSQNEQKMRNVATVRNSDYPAFPFKNEKSNSNEFSNSFDRVQDDVSVLNEFESSVKFDEQQFNGGHFEKGFSGFLFCFSFIGLFPA